MSKFKFKVKIDITSYITTILWTILAACIFSGGIIYYAQYDVINNAVKYDDKLLKEYIENIVIGQNEDLEAKHPNDYRIDIHLGYLHKVVEKYDKAEEYYIKAVAKAPLGIYKPLYELGCFYVERERLDDATNILNKLPNKSGRALITYQSYLSRKIGDAYFKKGLYYNALENYELSLRYWHKHNKPDSKYSKELYKNISESAVNVADICVNENKIDESIFFLKRAEKVDSKNFNVLYKLALTTALSKPEESYQYFKILFKADPQKVDYMAYYKLLDGMAYLYEEQGEYTKAKLFAFRAKNLLDFVSENLLYAQDIDFKITKKSLYNLSKKYKVLITFNLKNISNMPINRLNIDVIYKLNGKEFEKYTRSVVEKSNPLLIGESCSDITIVPKTFRKYKQNEIPEITAEIYLYKSKDRKLCVFNGKLFENQKVNIKASNYHIDCSSYIKFFAKQILNFKYSIQTFLNFNK